MLSVCIFWITKFESPNEYLQKNNKQKIINFFHVFILKA